MVLIFRPSSGRRIDRLTRRAAPPSVAFNHSDMSALLEAAQQPFAAVAWHASVI
jgi:hypothetical protein